MKRRTAKRITLFIALVIASAFGVLLYLPFGKEGASWEELPIFLTVATAAFALAVVWWVAVGLSLRKALLGWIVLLMPFAAHGWTAFSLIYERYEGERFAKKVTIADYREEPIEWPGFDGPVGYQVTFDLNHPTGFKKLVNPPEIRMGPEIEIPFAALSYTNRDGSGYFKDTYLETKTGNLALLKTVLFQRAFTNPTTETDYMKWSSHYRFNPLDKTRFQYQLLPGIIDYLLSPSHICINARVVGVEICADGAKPESGCASPNLTRLDNPVYANGTDLTAFWLAPPAIDMSHALTSVLRSSSILQNKPADWEALHERMLPAGLKQAGYGLCEPGPESHTASRVCFCRMQAASQ